MARSLAHLLWQLRSVERAVPSEVRDEANFLGLRVDENGREVSIARAFFSGGSQPDPSDVAFRLARVPAFANALGATGLTLAPSGGDADDTHLHGLSAGDGAYPARCSDHCFSAHRDEAGTLGWFFSLDGIVVGLGSYHVFCPGADATPLHSTCVYGRAGNGTQGDYRIGTLWDYDRADATRARLFDCALIRIDDVRMLSGQMSACDDGLRKPYPQRLAAPQLITAAETFYMVGMQTRSCRTTRFRGVGSRKLGRSGRYSWYSEQLFFDRCSIPGDSGAIIVHAPSNTVAGLTLAADALFTIANPLYRKPWHFAGLRTFGSLTLPDLRIRS